MKAITLVLYNITMRLYGIGILIASPFNKKAKLWIAGRKTVETFQLQESGNAVKGKRIWVHCASLGEFEQGRPVIEKVKKLHPEHQVILTFFSPSGYEIRKNYEYADAVLYLPLDTKRNAEKFIAQIKPDVALFVKYEFWYHYLHQLKIKNIPSILFSSVFRKEQIFFEWYGIFFTEILGMFSKVFVQNNESKKLLNTIGIEAEIASDTRIDRVSQIAESIKSFPLIEKFKGRSKIFIAGSTWKKDEGLITRLINENTLSNYKYIIAPHDIDLNRIKELKKNIHSSCIYLSELTEANTGSSQVIIVDSIGQLVSLYAYGNIAYVGGAFNAGVHNVLEPAVYGMPILFGPNFLKSIEARKLNIQGAAFSISHYKELLIALRVISERERQPVNNFSKLSKKYITERTGGTQKVYDSLSRWI